MVHLRTKPASRHETAPGDLAPPLVRFLGQIQDGAAQLGRCSRTTVEGLQRSASPGSQRYSCSKMRPSRNATHIVLARGPACGHSQSREVAKTLTKGEQAGPLILEGAVQNESYEHLLAELMYWLGHHRVQVAVGFKIYLRSEGGHMLAPHMFITAMEKTTSGLVLHAPLHFGAGSDCIAARLAKYQLRLDVGMLFEDTSDAGKPGTAGFMQVDLYHIRDDVYTSINQDPESMGEVPNAVLEEHARNLQDFAARNNLTYEPDARNANTMRSTRTTHRFRRVQFGV
ncbi:hypothetical protein WJX72_003850 [[Myrmecia] bisecta]|uniref:Uncharacterized protein n=1 Tax=[Myrmecia] bisecta TaxID=41462 RepID=A0AAW1QEP9_9CHLO